MRNKVVTILLTVLLGVSLFLFTDIFIPTNTSNGVQAEESIETSSKTKLQSKPEPKHKVEKTKKAEKEDKEVVGKAKVKDKINQKDEKQKAETKSQLQSKQKPKQELKQEIKEKSKPQPQPKPEPEPKVVETIDKPMWVKVNLNFRNKPGTNGKIIKTLGIGTKVQALEKMSNGWFYIGIGDNKGYVSGKYLSDTEIKKPIPKPSISHNSNSDYAPNTIYVIGKAIKYENGGVENGQTIIDKNSNMASTWGGAEIFSGNDNFNTHFIGHNPGCFNGIWNLKKGDTITVTDNEGNPTHYIVTKQIYADLYAVTKDGVNYWDEITGYDGGERITLQTCANELFWNHFIFAKKK